MSFNVCDYATYAVIDLETTGLDVSRDRILEIGVVLLDKHFNKLNTYSTLVRPTITVGAEKIHHVSEDMLRHAPTFEMISYDLMALLDDKILVAHNASFEIKFLNKEFNDIDFQLSKLNFLDTLRFAQTRLTCPQHNLSKVAEFLDIEPYPAHEALPDALTTAAVVKTMNDKNFLTKEDKLAVPTYAYNLEEGYQADFTNWYPREVVSLVS